MLGIKSIQMRLGIRGWWNPNWEYRLDFIYRSINEWYIIMGNTLIKGYVTCRYSTCFVDNLLKSGLFLIITTDKIHWKKI